MKLSTRPFFCLLSKIKFCQIPRDLSYNIICNPTWCLRGSHFLNDGRDRRSLRQLSVGGFGQEVSQKYVKDLLHPHTSVPVEHSL